MRAALYIRVSTEEQARQGHSIDAQRDRLLDFCRSQNWEVVDVYVDDGYSAKDLNRPAIKRLLKDCENNKFDIVVVYRLDRLVRNVINLHEILEHFEKYNIKFRSATEIFDTTTAIGKFFITIVAAIAQWERENLAERTRMGMEKNFHKGRWNGGKPPFGYRIDEKTGKLVIHEEEAKIVRRIFDLYKSRGLKEIAKILNKEGLKSQSGAKWGDYSVKYVITNPIYAGYIHWDGMLVEGDHEAIISKEEFEEIQRLKEKRYIKREKTSSTFALSGVLRCARCGSSLVGNKKKKKEGYYHRIYRCSARTHKSACNMPHLTESALEKAVLEQLNLIIKSDWNKEIAESVEDKELEQKRKALERELNEIRKRKRKWQDAYANDAITIEELRELMKEEHEREQAIKKQLAEIDYDSQNKLTTEEVVEFAKNLKENWNILDTHHKKKIIQTLFREIVVDAEPLSARRFKVKIVSIKTH